MEGRNVTKDQRSEGAWGVEVEGWTEGRSEGGREREGSGGEGGTRRDIGMEGSREGGWRKTGRAVGREDGRGGRNYLMEGGREGWMEGERGRKGK